MKKLFQAIATRLAAGESLVVATIFDKSGSAPRTAGAKMAITRDGATVGTIGGGRLEADAVRLAAEAFRSRRSILHAFDLSGRDVAGMDMICGGQGEVLLDFIDAADHDNRAVYAGICDAIGRREKAWLITALGDGQGAYRPARRQCLVRHDGSLVGRFDGEPAFLAKLTEGPAKIAIHAEVLEGQRFLVEPVRPTGVAYIFGAGHVSQKIAPLAETVGFRTVVLDDRAEYASRARFPAPTELLVLDSFDRLPALEIDGDSYLVIVTRGHLYDKNILEWSLRTGAGYIGMIGSRRKRDKIYAVLAGQGFGDADFRRVHSPIGTDIGAETPEELAVSIVGELIKVRAERESARHG
ncbi:XdhC family aldehyde oxidoreductase maturation factor [Anaeroselena agilis]|uniref:XdhC family protein n=1 Tax=Anaeroselena agilis TaxID=3063788 RepID=A0ABU3NWS4_9FIRM|nr:XdhC family protein [Selenomonadales bacterium 4137-cl]